MDEGKYWQAVLDREIAMDGQFVYAVRSTGVYCRPGCHPGGPGESKCSFSPDRRRPRPKASGLACDATQTDESSRSRGWK